MRPQLCKQDINLKFQLSRIYSRIYIQDSLNYKLRLNQNLIFSTTTSLPMFKTIDFISQIIVKIINNIVKNNLSEKTDLSLQDTQI